MPGTLYLIPNTLGPTDAVPGALSHVIPEHVQALTASLDYFVAENAKTARAFLKLVAIDHPLAKTAAGNRDRRTEREHAGGGAGRLAGAAAGRARCRTGVGSGRAGGGRPGRRPGAAGAPARHHGAAAGGAVVAAAGRDGERAERAEFRLQRLLADRCGAAHQAHQGTGAAVAQREADPAVDRDAVPQCARCWRRWWRAASREP